MGKNGGEHLSKRKSPPCIMTGFSGLYKEISGGSDIRQEAVDHVRQFM